jgi:signal transduction histidine kinase
MTMNLKTRLLFWGCVLTVCGVIALQFVWLTDYYRASQRQFGQEVNLAFEDAVKKEFAIRCDTVEQAIFRYLMDTSVFTISGRWDLHFVRYIYTVASKARASDRAEFSNVTLNFPLTSPSDPRRAAVARNFARQLRDEDLERHIVFYRTQELGTFVDEKTKTFIFDTARLRPLYAGYLAERGIREPFRFLYTQTDSTFNQSHFPDSLSSRYPFITKAIPTALVDPNPNQYVRALFGPPQDYLFSKMIWMLLGSLVLAVLTALSLTYLLKTLQKEKRLSAIKNDFISQISHEFKTPLSTVSGALEALEDFNALDDPSRSLRYIRMARAETRRLSDMVTKVLDLSIYERSDFAINPSPLSVEPLIRQLMQRYTLTRDKVVRCSYEGAPALPPVSADEWHLTHALDNLFDNAVKYADSPVDISIRTHTQGGYLLLSVTDNGAGILPSDQPLIWDKFYRAPGTRASVKGQGLGLNYVRTIIDKHGGWSSVFSEGARKGSTFTLAIPL